MWRTHFTIIVPAQLTIAVFQTAHHEYTIARSDMLLLYLALNISMPDMCHSMSAHEQTPTLHNTLLYRSVNAISAIALCMEFIEWILYLLHRVREPKSRARAELH